METPTLFVPSPGDEFVFHDSVPISICDRIIVNDLPGEENQLSQNT